MKRFELLPDEEIIISNPKHWKNYLAPGLCIAACAVAGFLKLDNINYNAVNALTGHKVIPQGLVPYVSYLEAIVMALVIIGICIYMIDISYTRYYVTSKRIISSTGFLNVTMSEMMLDKCETVSLSQKLYERFFNSGDILCISAGASIYLDDVYDARKFKQTIVNILSKFEN